MRGWLASAAVALAVVSAATACSREQKPGRDAGSGIRDSKGAAAIPESVTPPPGEHDHAGMHMPEPENPERRIPDPESRIPRDRSHSRNDPARRHPNGCGTERHRRRTAPPARGRAAERLQERRRDVARCGARDASPRRAGPVRDAERSARDCLQPGARGRADGVYPGARPAMRTISRSRARSGCSRSARSSRQELEKMTLKRRKWTVRRKSLASRLVAARHPRGQGAAYSIAGRRGDHL